jgi:hypothetical protein
VLPKKWRLDFEWSFTAADYPRSGERLSKEARRSAPHALTLDAPLG